MRFGGEGEHHGSGGGSPFGEGAEEPERGPRLRAEGVHGDRRRREEEVRQRRGGGKRAKNVPIDCLI